MLSEKNQIIAGTAIGFGFLVVVGLIASVGGPIGFFLFLPIGVTFSIILVIAAVQASRACGRGKDPNNNVIVDENRDAECPAQHDQSTSRPVERSEPSEVMSAQQRAEPARQRNAGTVEVSGVSSAENISFAVYIDGKVVGYIGMATSVFSVPSGMHEMVIFTNDSERKQIYRQNVLFNTGKSIRISKAMRKYLVTVQ